MTATNAESGSRENRRFSVSSNRDSARHRIRYVEAGGASVDTGECTFCQANPELDWSSTEHVDGKQPDHPSPAENHVRAN